MALGTPVMGTRANGSASQLAPTLPAHATGDLLLVLVYHAGTTSHSTSASGWTKLGQTTGSAASVSIFGKIATSNAESAPTIAFGSTAKCIVHAAKITGTASTIEDAIGATTWGASGTTSSHTLKGGTTTRANSYLCTLDGGGANTSISGATGWTSAYNSGVGNPNPANLYFGYRSVASSGTTISDVSATGANAGWADLTIEVREPSAGGTDALTATGLSTGAASLGTPTLGTIHALTATSLSASAASLGSPSLGQAHALSAPGLSTAAASLGTPALGAPGMTNTTWDATALPGAGVTLSNSNKTATGASGYGQSVIGTTAISGKKFFKLNFTGNIDIALGIAAKPLNPETDIGGQAATTYGPAYGYRRTHGFVQGPDSYTIITAWPYYATATSSDDIGIGYDSSTRLMEVFKNGTKISVASGDVQEIPQLANATYYPAATILSGASVTIDGNPASIPAGYTALDASSGYDLTATGISTGAASLGTPTLGIESGMVATPIATGAASLGTPSITQVHALTATGITGGAAILGTPGDASGLVNPPFTLIPAEWQALMPAYRGAPTSGAKVTYLDTVGGNDSNDGASESTPKLTFSAAMTRVASQSPGATLLVKKGSNIVGPVTITNVSGTAENPNFFSTYGSGSGVVTISNVYGHEDRTADLWLTDCLTINYGSSYWIFDGRVQGGIVCTDAREAGIKIEAFSTENKAGTGFEFYNIETHTVSMGIAADTGEVIIERCYFHDGTMSVDNETPDTEPGGGDYGANGIRLAGVDSKTVRFNYAIRLRAPSPDYGQDGGFVELAGQSGTGKNIQNVEIAYNWVEDCEGFAEGGGDGVYSGGIPATFNDYIEIHHNISVNSEHFATFHHGGQYGATWGSNVSYHHNTIVQTDRSSKVVAGVATYLVMASSNGGTNVINYHHNLFYVNQPTLPDVISIWDASMGTTENWRSDNAYYIPASGAYTIANTGGNGGCHIFNTWDETLKTGEIRRAPTATLFVDALSGNYHLQSGSDAYTLGAGALGLEGTHTLTPNGLSTGAASLGSPSLTQKHALTASGINTGAVSIGTPAVAQVHALSATGITGSAASLPTPTLGQGHALAADALAGSAASLGTPDLGQVHSLEGATLATGAATLGTPTLGQVHALTATGLAASGATLGSPTLTQVHALTASGIATGSPTLGTPDLATSVFALTATGLQTGAAEIGLPAIGQVHGLTATNLSTGPPGIGTPDLAQIHALTATGIAGSAATLGTPSASPNVDNLSADALQTGAALLGTPSLGQVHVFGGASLTTGAAALGTPDLGQVHSLTANAITTAAPTLGSPALGQIHTLSADALATGPATLGTPDLSQAHALAATALATGAASLGTPELGQAHALAAQSLVGGPAAIAAPSIAQIHALAATDLLTAAASLGTPSMVPTTGLTATDLQTGAASLGEPTLGQRHALAAAGVAGGPTTIGAPSLTQIHALQPTGLATGPAAFQSPTLRQAHALTALGIEAGPASLGSPSMFLRFELTALGIATGPALLGTPALGVIVPEGENLNPIIRAGRARLITRNGQEAIGTLIVRNGRARAISPTDSPASSMITRTGRARLIVR